MFRRIPKNTGKLINHRFFSNQSVDDQVTKDIANIGFAAGLLTGSALMLSLSQSIEAATKDNDRKDTDSLSAISQKMIP